MAEAGEEKRLAREIAGVLDECRLSHAVHTRKLRELSALRSSAPPGLFFPSFARALTPLFDFPRRSLAAERTVRFVSAFVALADANANAAASGVFLEEFLRFLLVASGAAHRTARFRSCQIISEIIMRLPDDAEVSDQLWDEVIDKMKERVGDKVPAIRAFAVRALSRFANDVESGDILILFLQTLSQEQNAEVRKTIILSLPPSNATTEAIVGSTLDVSESVRRSAYRVLASKFPLQSLSIKHRTIILQRGLSDRSSSVTKECLKMLKDEWLTKSCGGDPLALLRFLDVETYESVGEAVMEALLKDGIVPVQEGQSIRQYLKSSNKSEGTEAAVYASEASDNNDLLEGILPVTISDYVDLVRAHLSAGPNYHFACRQLLLLGAILDFSDTANRKIAGGFVQELLLRPLEFEVDDDGSKIVIGDGISLGGDRDWAKAVSELARKVHASMGEFEAVITGVVKELARPCRDRTADYMQWIHCLAVTGLLLENIDSLWSLHGKAIEPSELLHSLFLPGAKQIHVDVQRVAMRCLCLYGLLERSPSEELVRQLRLSFINGPAPVSIMASKALIDLATWHGPQAVDKATGMDLQQSGDEKNGFISVDLSNLNEDANIGLLDLLYSGFDKDDWGANVEGDDHESVHAVLGEGFAKILLLGENYPTISTGLHPSILGKFISLYFCDETKNLQRSVSPELSFLSCDLCGQVASCPDKKTPAGKSYLSALCRIALLIQFRSSEQGAIKCMRGLLNSMIISLSTDKELVKELTRMAARLKSLDDHPDEELSQEQANVIFGKLGLDGSLKMDTSAVPPPSVLRSARTAPNRRRVRREASPDDEEISSVPEVPMTPSLASMRSQRASKTAAMTKMTTKTTFELSDDDEDGESDVTSEGTSD
ncbi:hypothetical protein COCNU_scaffold023732G000010 [Cocos nucifera]|nr:hypothetical protein [Cocos nucifera]